MQTNPFSNAWTKTLSQIYPEYVSFESDYSNLGVSVIPFKDPAFLRHIYIALMGEYMSTPIASFSEDQFKLKLMTRIASKGPEYERMIDVQKDLLSMDAAALMKSAEAVYNSAMNPSKPLDTVDGRVLTVNQQNTTSHYRSKLDAYMILMRMSNSDLTANFVAQFEDLFTKILATSTPLFYETEEGSITI